MCIMMCLRKRLVQEWQPSPCVYTCACTHLGREDWARALRWAALGCSVHWTGVQAPSPLMYAPPAGSWHALGMGST